MKAPYRPHTLGTPASVAYDMPCGTCAAAAAAAAAAGRQSRQDECHLSGIDGLSMADLSPLCSRSLH
jgi:hypothetical protein